MFASINRKLIAGIAALALVALAGGAYAATSSSPASSRPAFLGDVARRLHVTPEQLTAALKGARVDQLNAAVAAGRLTQAQANAIKKRIQSGLPPAAPGAFGHAFGRAFGPRGKLGLPAVPGPPGPGQPGGRLAAAATYLGVTPQKLFSQLASGKSLAQLAKQAGKPVSGLKAAMTAAIKAKLDRAVSQKVITSAQESKILGNISAHLDAEINGTFPTFMPGMLRQGRPAVPWMLHP